jgi:23S rRNA pseudouridine1911/1915/1917 synthase
LVKPETGRHHQIRIQLALRGHPVVGDFKYGSRKRIARGKAILLHALKMMIPHPTRKQPLAFVAPLPPYWPGKVALERIC